MAPMPKDLDPGQQRVQITTGNLTLSTLGSLPVCPPPNFSNVLPIIFDGTINRPSCCQPWGGYAGVGMGNSPQGETEHPPFAEAAQGHDIRDKGGGNKRRAPVQGLSNPGTRASLQIAFHPISRQESPKHKSQDFPCWPEHPRIKNPYSSRKDLGQPRTGPEDGCDLDRTYNSTGSWTGHLVPVTVLCFDRF